MMKYDEIVVGSGISGLTMAQLLGLLGHKVLLIEKAPIIGGSLSRFYRKGIPFDTGFHFTGGFGETQTLHDMQTVLGIDNDIKPIFLKDKATNQVFFEDIKKKFDLSSDTGYSEVITQLIEFFPDDETGIRIFFKKAEEICKNTPMLDIREPNDIPIFSIAVEEDFISLSQAMNELVHDPYLKTILSLYCLCYGTKPEEVSFATHCRISLWLFKSIARVEKGGDAFISAFKKQFKNNRVDVKTNTFIDSFSDVSGKNVNAVKLNSGEIVQFENCILALHPKEILKIIPNEYLKKGFRERINDFEESNGFFSVYGYLEDYTKSFKPSLNSILPNANLDEFFDPDVNEISLVVMTSNEIVNGKNYKIVNAFEPSFYENIKQFDNEDRKSPEYEKYKREKTKQIEERIYRHFPEYKNHLRILESASMLTFKDYLHSPYGSAYGIKQKVGQFNLLGRLPLRNLYAVGQSALLPGLVGGMMSSFTVMKSIIGKENFQDFIEKRLNIT